MKNRIPNAFDWITIALLAIGGPSAVFIAVSGWEKFSSVISSQATSAWVQAIGSIAALFIALRLAADAENRQTVQDEKVARHRLEIVQAAVMQLVMACVQVTARPKLTVVFGIDIAKTKTTIINDARALLADIDLFQIPDPAIAMDVVRLRHLARDVVKAYSLQEPQENEIAAVITQALEIAVAIAKKIGKPFDPEPWLKSKP